jgi:hypothetical protein
LLSNENWNDQWSHKRDIIKCKSWMQIVLSWEESDQKKQK